MAGVIVLVWLAAASLAAQESGALPATSRPALARMLGVHSYEYDEVVDLSLDASAVIDVNGSIAAMVALHGVQLDVDPEARFDRQAIKKAFEGSGVTVTQVTSFRRHGRRFVHVRLAASDIRQVPDAEPLSWSRYRLDRSDRDYHFVQNVGPPTRGSVNDVGWTGDELVAFRVHLPSKITFHNSQNFERGNTLVWEQRLRDRLAGAPLHLDARMETQSILYRTLWLFAGTFLAAPWVLREGAHVTAYDPKGMERARAVKTIEGVAFAASALEAIDGAEALIIATEWSEFANVDLALVKERMVTPIVFDGRNLFDSETMGQLGFRYHSIGRASITPH